MLAFEPKDRPTAEEHDTKYYYEVGIGHTTRTFWFTTPPKVGPDVPYTFGLIGDLGQSYDSNITLMHYEINPTKGQTMLFVGDISYADNYPDHDNRRWDSWGRFAERSTTYQPWIWTTGNHEIDFAPEIGEDEPFKPYTHRYKFPYMSSQSTSPFWYSIKRASAYILVLASYSAYGKYTPQYKWLEQELPKVNRTETPWLIVLIDDIVCVAEKEPILSNFLYASILSHDCLERALGFIIANRLQNNTLLETQLMDIFCDVMVENRGIHRAIRLDLQVMLNSTYSTPSVPFNDFFH